MKVLSILSLVFLSYEYVHAYSNCSGCRVVTIEDGTNWGVENDDWCIVSPSKCKLTDAKCKSYPQYECCKKCDVSYEDDDDKWGIENGDWCSIPYSCSEQAETGNTGSGNTGSGSSGEVKEVTYGSNPIEKSMYTADPAPMVYGDTLYVYTTHDENNLKDNFYTMLDWYAFSTKDLVNWTNHGKIFSLNDISWADDRAWAAQCVERNGKFYLYCPVHKRNGGMAIAVGVSDKPTGPFKDIGHPLVDEPDWNDIDPTVFIDDDGQAYLYFGNPELRYVLLNEDMVSYNKSKGVQKIPMTQESFGRGNDGRTTYGEGPWFYKRNDLYYMVYAAFRPGYGSEHLGYSTSKNPTGPWKYGGVLMTEEGGNSYTNHPGVVDFKGHSLLFYHTGQLPGGGSYHRSVCVTEFNYEKDGSIKPVPKNNKITSI